MKQKKNNDIEEMIDLVEVEQSKTPDYQGALDRLKSIDLDYVSKVLNSEQLENVSDYSIHDHPTLEMMGDIETLQKLIDSFVNQQSNNKTSDEMFKEIGLSAWIGNDDDYSLYEPEQNLYITEDNKRRLMTYAEFSKVKFNDLADTRKKELEIYFYPDEGIDFDKLTTAAKKRMEEKGWL